MSVQVSLPELPGEVLELVVAALPPTWRGVLRHVSPTLRASVDTYGGYEQRPGRNRAATRSGRSGRDIDVTELCSAAPDGDAAVKLLQWALRQGCPVSTATAAAVARAGCVAGLTWLHGTRTNTATNINPTVAAVASHDSGTPMTGKWSTSGSAPSVICQPEVAAAAAAGGHTSTLAWLRQLSPPCPWDESSTAAAAAAGHLSTLQWLRHQNCPWNSLTVRDLSLSRMHFTPAHPRTQLRAAPSRPKVVRSHACEWAVDGACLPMPWLKPCLTASYPLCFCRRGGPLVVATWRC